VEGDGADGHLRRRNWRAQLARVQEGCASAARRDEYSSGVNQRSQRQGLGRGSKLERDDSEPNGVFLIRAKVRNLIHRLSVEYPLGRAPRIHGDLLELGDDVAMATIGKSMAKRPELRSSIPDYHGWRTHPGPGNNAPEPRTVRNRTEDTEASVPALGGSPHRYWHDAA
jgi:hypothetical protein